MDANPQDGKRLYTILGVASNASASEIRNAYRKLALKWHPDKFHTDAGRAKEAMLRFQEIQGAYSVLFDEGKRTLYDLGLYEPDDDEEATEGMSSFVGEISNRMAKVNAESGKISSFEDLQQLFVQMFSADLKLWNLGSENIQPDSVLQGRKREADESFHEDLSFCAVAVPIASDSEEKTEDTTAMKRRRGCTSVGIS